MFDFDLVLVNREEFCIYSIHSWIIFYNPKVWIHQTVIAELPKANCGIDLSVSGAKVGSLYLLFKKREELGLAWRLGTEKAAMIHADQLV